MKNMKYNIHKASEIIKLDLLTDVATTVYETIDIHITNNLYMLKASHFGFLRMVKQKSIK